MVGIRQSVADETRQYNVEPAIIANACEEALKRLGKVLQVSPESGTIRGTVKLGFMNKGEVVLRIVRTESGTELNIRTTRDEGLVTSGGAQKAMAKFLDTLGRDSRLAGKAATSW